MKRSENQARDEIRPTYLQDIAADVDVRALFADRNVGVTASFCIGVFFEPVQGDMREGNFFVGAFVAAFKQTAD